MRGVSGREEKRHSMGEGLMRTFYRISSLFRFLPSFCVIHGGNKVHQAQENQFSF